jgi:RNA polymerase sigma-70 factor (ECF subfamily)
MDEDRWEEVHARHYRRLVALVTVVAQSQSEAEEAVQEAFVRALGPIGHRAAIRDPEGWLYRVAVNVVRTRRRRRENWRRIARLLGRGEPTRSGDGEAAESRIVLWAALRRLPERQREALALHYLADLSLEQIAARTGAPVGTVKARLSRGRNGLRELLVDEATSGGKR